MLKKLIFFFALVLISQQGFSNIKEIKGCYRYQRQDNSWSHGYKVTGQLGQGRDFVGENFNKSKHYYVISWQRGDTTAIQLRGSHLSNMVEELKDLKGKSVSLKQGWAYCN